MLRHCRLGHLAPRQQLQCTREVLLRPGLTRVGQIPLFQTNVWLTMKPDLGRKSRFHWARMPWLVPGAGHSQVAQPGADGTCNPLLMGESVNPWTCHQERTHKLSAYAKQPAIGSHCAGEGILCINAQSVPRYDETSDDDNYQPGFGAQFHYGTHEPGLDHPDVTSGCQERWLVWGPSQSCACCLVQARGDCLSTTTCCGLGACQSPGNKCVRVARLAKDRFSMYIVMPGKLSPALAKWRENTVISSPQGCAASRQAALWLAWITERTTSSIRVCGLFPNIRTCFGTNDRNYLWIFYLKEP